MRDFKKNPREKKSPEKKTIEKITLDDDLARLGSSSSEGGISKATKEGQPDPEKILLKRGVS